MQASQSSNASDLLTPELKPDPAFPRSFPSPFTAPIQAARKYFERQRGDAWQAGSRETGAQETGAQETGAGETGSAERVEESLTQGQGGQNPGGQNPGSREQDRRLERSLYGHSIEAALSFDGPLSGDGLGRGGAERAFFAESDGSETPFAYAEPGPLPDPEAVRSAILRLARETELRGAPGPNLAPHLAPHLASHLASSSVKDTPGRDRAATAAEIELAERRASAASASESRSSEPEISRQRTAAGESAPPLAFRDVARRVWGADYPQFLSGQQTGPGPDAATAKTVAQSAAQTAPPTAAPTASGAPALPGEAIQQISSNEDGPAADAAGAASPARSGIHLQPSGVYTASSREAVEEFAQEISTEYPKAAGLQSAVSIAAAKAAPAMAGTGVAQEEPALAHDACNLLSALALYSELLASPGVLGREHRHYAEELKLMAGRSQVLIDRLLRVAAERKARGFPFGSQPGGPPNAAEGRPGAAANGEAAPAGGRDAPVDAVAAGALAAQATPDAQARVEAAECEAKAVAIAQVEAPDRMTRDIAEAQQSAAAPETDEQAEEAGDAAVEAVPRFPAVEAERDGEAAVAAGFTENAPSEIAAGTAEEAQSTSLVYLLMRWGSLLSTLAQGTLEVGFGPHAATPVPAGAEALERILVNLVRNARAATALGGAIRIGVGVADAVAVIEPAAAARTSPLPAEGPEPAAPLHAPRLRGTMVLTVDDSGCGMSEAQVRRILGETNVPDEPALAAGSVGCGQSAGHGLSHGLSHGRRHGLGLQIVRQLVAASGGTLSIQSWPGRGTRVEIRWPVEVQPAAEALEAVPDAAAQSQQDRASAPERAGAGDKAADAPAEAEAEILVAAEVPSQTADAAPGAAPEPVDSWVREPGIEPVWPAAAEAAGLPSRGLAAAREAAVREAVGPDGFSEAELRAMMLRLHRAGPQERSPLSRRLDRRLWEARVTGGRQTDLRPRERAEGDRRFGIVGSTAPGSTASGSSVPNSGVGGPSAADPGFADPGFADPGFADPGFAGPGTRRAGWNHFGQNGVAHQDEASKGAIAC